MATVRFADVIARLKDERADLRAKHEAGMSGLELVRALAESMERAVAAIWREVAGEERGLALVALGGFARGELSPHSDVDLMVLHAGGRRAAEVSEPVFYALWDAGFTVGHAVRTVRESLKLARDNIEAETSFLGPRLIAGDTELYERFATGALEQTRARCARFLDDVRAMMSQRHRARGSATSQLEPNIKEGAGGLRDLHVLGWFEAVVPDHGLIGDRGRARLRDAAELLHRVRAALHYATDRATDTLLFQHQRPVALFLGYVDGERPAEDAFMRDLFTATRSVELIVSAIAADIAERPRRGAASSTSDVYVVERGRVVVGGEPDLAARPELALELFALGAQPGAAALRSLQRALERVDALPWTDAVRAAFMRLLRVGDPRALEAADDAGVFAKLLPEWDAVRCQPQHNVYHGFTVDAHLFNTVAQVRALADDDAEALARDVLADVGDPDLLLLAALLHDVGKGSDEDHSIRGERLAESICRRMGVAASRVDTIAWLVRHHLLLVEAATRRDLNDENFVVDVASRVRDAERARLLYLLSVADGRATGPTAWSPWKAGLVAELFTKVLHVIERGELISRESIELARLRSAELRNALTRYPSDAVEAHIGGMSRAYLLAFTPEVLIRHFALMHEPVVNGDVRVHISATDEPGVHDLTIVARDRPGLFAKVSGALALHGVNIVTAQGFTRADGCAIEVFRCVPSFDGTVEPERWTRIERDIGKAVRGRISLPVRLEEKRAAYPARVAKGKREAPKVIVDNAGSDFMTIVEVHAPDRVGLLYDITSVLADLSLDIQVAKIATYAEDVVDVFYVRDLDGQKIVDPEHLREIEHTLLFRLTSAR